jgi:hypothetical protein
MHLLAAYPISERGLPLEYQDAHTTLGKHFSQGRSAFLRRHTSMSR